MSPEELEKLLADLYLPGAHTTKIEDMADYSYRSASMGLSRAAFLAG